MGEVDRCRGGWGWLGTAGWLGVARDDREQRVRSGSGRQRAESEKWLGTAGWQRAESEQRAESRE
uniref:Uncharacterized protein n=1 Tax=Fagus sylvatica TaxID=28930 RepID=A0A2N9HGN7_FAGSY